MPRKEFLDAPGGQILYHEVTEDGYLLPCFQDSEEAAQKNFDSLPHKKCRNDDILLSSYLKTGTNWCWELTTMATRKQSVVTGQWKGRAMIEALPEEVQESLPSPRVLNTHVKVKYIPKEAKEKKIKTILLMRNPKDIVVSLYIHTRGLKMYQYDGKFENFLAMFMRGDVDYGSYPSYLQEWQRTIKDNPDWPIHVVYYEDLKENGVYELKRLCKYLELGIDDHLLGRTVDSCEIENMRRTKREKSSKERLEYENQMYKYNFHIIRKGQVGGWKDWFTVAQNEIFDKWWSEKTADLNMFRFRYTLP